MEAKAIAKSVRMSPIKLKPVASLVRGKNLAEALTILRFTPGKGAELFEKVVKSAAANAENNFNMNVDDLYVAEIYAHQGPTMKRWRAGSQVVVCYVLNHRVEAHNLSRLHNVHSLAFCQAFFDID